MCSEQAYFGLLWLMLRAEESDRRLGHSPSAKKVASDVSSDDPNSSTPLAANPLELYRTSPLNQGDKTRP